MATYASYKTLTSENFVDGSITASKLGAGAGHQYYTKWIYNERGQRCHHCADAGDCCEQANGKCCYWTVHQMLTKLHLKFGQVVEQVAAEHAVTVVNTQLVDRVETTLLKQLPLHQVVHLQYVLVVHGLVVSHIVAYQVWDVALTLTDITYLTSV